MDKNLARYIWRHTKRQQIWILLVVLASMYTYFLSFDVPKFIVNGPIQGKGFDTAGALQTYGKFTFNFPYLGSYPLSAGFELGRFGALVFLSLLFLLLVVVNGAFKLYINTYKGRLGERMLRRVRFELIDRVLRFPPGHFKRVKPAELATMVKDEVEPLGGFIGDAFVQPALLGGQAATALFFIIMQNLWLGTIAAGIVAVQLVIIPRMRKRLLVLGRERQLTARELSGRISEIAEGIAAVHGHDTSNFERADISARLGRIFKIRYDLYQWKFMVKFINNFLAQVTPFLFYLVGGYQVIKGTLDVGQLVAVIAAYKDLPTPLKDLIDWDQARQDVAIKYAQVYEQFDVGDMLDSRLQQLAAEPVPPLEHPVVTVNLSIVDDGGARLLDRVSLQIEPGETLALVGTAGGAEALAEALARVVRPEAGKISIGPHDMHELSESIVGRRMGYAASDGYLFQGTLRDNLLYSLKHAPLRPRAEDSQSTVQRRWEEKEALRSGNANHDIQADWIDYDAAGATGPGDLSASLLPVLDALLLSNDLIELALRTRIDPARHANIVANIVAVRQAFREKLQSENIADAVTPFASGIYNPEATVSENLLFGAATGPALANNALAENAYFRSALSAAGLEEELYRMGLEIAKTVVELFRDLAPDHPFFQNLTLMSADELPGYQALLKRIQGKPYATINAADRSRVITLALPYIEPRDRFGILNEPLMARLVTVRESFLANLPEALRASIEPYDPERYNAAATLLDNVLLGRISHQHAEAGEHIRAIVRDVVDVQGLREEVVDIGLAFNVGVGGRRLTLGQRQKVNLARTLLKRPDYLIINRALLALDQQTQRRILTNLIEWARGIGYKPAVVAVLSSPHLASYFDRVIIFERGMPVANGPFETLAAENESLKKLLS